MPLSNELLESCFIKAGELKKNDTSLSSLLAFYRDCYISSTSLPVSCLGLSEAELDKLYSTPPNSPDDNSIIVIPPGISHWPDLGHDFHKIHIKPRPNFHYSLFGEGYLEENEDGEDSSLQALAMKTVKKRKNAAASKPGRKKKKKDESGEAQDEALDEEDEVAEEEVEEDSLEATPADEDKATEASEVPESTSVKEEEKEEEKDDLDRLAEAYITPVFSDVRSEEEKREEDGWSPSGEATDKISFFLDLETNQCDGELADLFAALSSERQSLFKYVDSRLNGIFTEQEAETEDAKETEQDPEQEDASKEDSLVAKSEEPLEVDNSAVAVVPASVLSPSPVEVELPTEVSISPSLLFSSEVSSFSKHTVESILEIIFAKGCSLTLPQWDHCIKHLLEPSMIYAALCVLLERGGLSSPLVVLTKFLYGKESIASPVEVFEEKFFDSFTHQEGLAASPSQTHESNYFFTNILRLWSPEDASDIKEKEKKFLLYLSIAEHEKENTNQMDVETSGSISLPLEIYIHFRVASALLIQLRQSVLLLSQILDKTQHDNDEKFRQKWDYLLNLTEEKKQAGDEPEAVKSLLGDATKLKLLDQLPNPFGYNGPDPWVFSELPRVLAQDYDGAESTLLDYSKDLEDLDPELFLIYRRANDLLQLFHAETKVSSDSPGASPTETEEVPFPLQFTRDSTAEHIEKALSVMSRGMNPIFVDPCSQLSEEDAAIHRSICMAKIIRSFCLKNPQNPSYGPFLVVTHLSNLDQFEAGLRSVLDKNFPLRAPGQADVHLDIIPYYGSENDRLSFRTYLKSTAFPIPSHDHLSTTTASSTNVMADPSLTVPSIGGPTGVPLNHSLASTYSSCQVLLINYETLLLDLHYFKEVIWAITLYDEPWGLFRSEYQQARQTIMQVLRPIHRLIFTRGFSGKHKQEELDQIDPSIELYGDNELDQESVLNTETAPALEAPVSDTPADSLALSVKSKKKLLRNEPLESLGSSVVLPDSYLTLSFLCPFFLGLVHYAEGFGPCNILNMTRPQGFYPTPTSSALPFNPSTKYFVLKILSALTVGADLHPDLQVSPKVSETGEYLPLSVASLNATEDDQEDDQSSLTQFKFIFGLSAPFSWYGLLFKLSRTHVPLLKLLYSPTTPEPSSCLVLTNGFFSHQIKFSAYTDYRVFIPSSVIYTEEFRDYYLDRELKYVVINLVGKSGVNLVRLKINSIDTPVLPHSTLATLAHSTNIFNYYSTLQSQEAAAITSAAGAQPTNPLSHYIKRTLLMMGELPHEEAILDFLDIDVDVFSKGKGKGRGRGKNKNKLLANGASALPAALNGLSADSSQPGGSGDLEVAPKGKTRGPKSTKNLAQKVEGDLSTAAVPVKTPGVRGPKPKKRLLNNEEEGGEDGKASKKSNTEAPEDENNGEVKKKRGKKPKEEDPNATPADGQVVATTSRAGTWGRGANNLTFDEEMVKYVLRKSTNVFHASIIIHARQRFLGVFKSEAEASKAFQIAYYHREGKLFGYNLVKNINKDNFVGLLISASSPSSPCPLFYASIHSIIMKRSLQLLLNSYFLGDNSNDNAVQGANSSLVVSRFKGKITKDMKLSDGNYISNEYYSLIKSDAQLINDIHASLLPTISSISSWVTTHNQPPSYAVLVGRKGIVCHLPALNCILGRASSTTCNLFYQISAHRVGLTKSENNVYEKVPDFNMKESDASKNKTGEDSKDIKEEVKEEPTPSSESSSPHYVGFEPSATMTGLIFNSMTKLRREDTINRVTSDHIPSIHLTSDPSVAKEHVCISWCTQKNHFFIKALHPSGFYLDGTHHKPEEHYIALASGSIIQIGREIFYFLLPKGPSIIPPAPILPRIYSRSHIVLPGSLTDSKTQGQLDNPMRLRANVMDTVLLGVLMREILYDPQHVLDPNTAQRLVEEVEKKETNVVSCVSTQAIVQKVPRNPQGAAKKIKEGQ